MAAGGNAYDRSGRYASQAAQALVLARMSPLFDAVGPPM
jgi:hypothetical protein